MEIANAIRVAEATDVKRRKCVAKKKRAVTMTGIVMAAVFFLSVFACIWTQAAERDVHVAPSYPMMDIASYLERNVFTEADYDILYHQTGLSRSAVDLNNCCVPFIRHFPFPCRRRLL